MLFEAAYWRPEIERPSLDEGLADPELAKLLTHWGRDGDTAVIADDDGAPIGAAWYRFWTDDDHSYGYVETTVPELAIGVVADRRGEGIGAALIQELLKRARAQNITQISLSVEKDNSALHLYERCGFKSVGELGNAWTMVANV